MLKGIYKNIMVIQTAKSSCFEAAYFVVRRERVKDAHRENEMLKEANRMLAEQDAVKQAKRRGEKSRNGSILFCTGALLGSVLVALLWGLSALLS